MWTGQISNFRDLGGRITSDGALVVPGRLFRSAQLAGLPEEAAKELEDLGIHAVYDFRTAQERSRFPDTPINGAKNIWLNVLSDDMGSLAASLQPVFEDPRRASHELSTDRIRDLYLGVYRNLVSLPSALAAYGAFFRSLLAQPETPRLFHCVAGKDRTGWAAEVFLSLLGVSREEILEDYLLSNNQLIAAYKPMVEAFATAGGDPEIIENLLLVYPEYLDSAFSELSREYGSVPAYFTDGLGIGEAEQAALITAYTLR